MKSGKMTLTFDGRHVTGILTFSEGEGLPSLPNASFTATVELATMAARHVVNPDKGSPLKYMSSDTMIKIAKQRRVEVGKSLITILGDMHDEGYRNIDRAPDIKFVLRRVEESVRVMVAHGLHEERELWLR